MCCTYVTLDQGLLAWNTVSANCLTGWHCTLKALHSQGTALLALLKAGGKISHQYWIS
jgi:hypothetical protein